MGEYVFDNKLFDKWLNNKSDAILAKVDQETISTQEMIILILKNQTQYFYQMDCEFKKIDERFKWIIGIMITLFLGLYLKIFLD